jgi:hypothetical protein
LYRPLFYHLLLFYKKYKAFIDNISKLLCEDELLLGIMRTQKLFYLI